MKDPSLSLSKISVAIISEMDIWSEKTSLNEGFAIAVLPFRGESSSQSSECQILQDVMGVGSHPKRKQRRRRYVIALQEELG